MLLAFHFIFTDTKEKVNLPPAREVGEWASLQAVCNGHSLC